MSADTNQLQSGTKLLRVVEALSSYAVSGVSNKTLASGLQLDNAFITRAMQTLIEFGWARKDESSGLFHPSPRMGQVFGRVLNDIAKAERQLADIKHSFSINN